MSTTQTNAFIMSASWPARATMRPKIFSKSGRDIIYLAELHAGNNLWLSNKEMMKAFYVADIIDTVKKPQELISEG